jgi:hypothetical protein
MKHTYKVTVFALWTLLGLISPVLLHAQLPSELPCVAGSTDLLSPTYNGNTQKTRSWVCVDALGNVTSPVFTTSGSGVTSFKGRTGAVVPAANDYSAAQLSVAALTNGITATTQTAGDNTLKLATTAFVTTAVANTVFPVTSVFGRTGAVAAVATDYGTVGIQGGAGVLAIQTTGGQVLLADAASGGDQIALVAGTITAVDASGDNLSLNGGTVSLLDVAGNGIFTSTANGGTTTLIYGNSTETEVCQATTGTCTFFQTITFPTVATANNSNLGATTTYVVNKLATPTPIGSGTPNTGAFTTLTANTASPGTNTTQVATTAFVQAALSASGSLVKTATITLSSAQILALNSTPIQVVAGIAGHHLSLQWLVAEYVSGGTGFTPGGGTFRVQLGSTVGTPIGSGFIPFSALVLSGTTNDLTDGYAAGTNGTNGVGAAITSASTTGQGIFAVCSSGPPLAGNGTIKITVSYLDFTL